MTTTQRYIRATAFMGILVVTVGCTPRKTVRGASISPQPPTTQQIPPVPEHKAVDTTQNNSQLLQDIQQLNKQTNAPTFGLVGGFYQLPVSHPGGALLIEHNVVSKNVTSSQRLVALQGQNPYAVLPLDTQQAQALETNMQQLLDAGVQFVQMSTADALTIMRAEQQALKQRQQSNNQQPMVWPTTLPAGVNLLVSVQSGKGMAGPTLVGRVIHTANGRLLALRSTPAAGPHAMGNLVLQLVHDALQRLAKQPAKPKNKNVAAPKKISEDPKSNEQTFTCPCLQPPDLSSK